eukprot:11522558-Karenia_brevis.AAC.1
MKDQMKTPQLKEQRKVFMAEFELLNQKIPEYIDLGRNLISILDHVASWMAELMWKRLDGISRGDEEEWNKIEGGCLHQGPTNTLLEKAHDISAKFYPMSPAPDRDPKRTKKNENEKVELPAPKEGPGTLGP